VWSCSCDEGGVEFAAKESRGRADVPARGGAAGAAAPPGGYAGGCCLPQRRQGDGRLGGRVGVGCAAAAVDGRAPDRNVKARCWRRHCGRFGRAHDRAVPGHYAAQDGVDAGVRGLAETGSTAATDVFALGRTVAALRDKCFAALRDECTGTSASLRCVTSAPRQSARRLRRLRRRWTRSWPRALPPRTWQKNINFTADHSGTSERHPPSRQCSRCSVRLFQLQCRGNWY